MVPSAATQAGDLLTLSDGGVSRVAKGADCKSAALWLRRFESCLPHQSDIAIEKSYRWFQNGRVYFDRFAKG